jgi:antitoxin component of MazEF toxin-antitoxin module
MPMLETVIGAAVGAVLGAVGTWIVSRSERRKAEQAAAEAAEQAAAVLRSERLKAQQAAAEAAKQAAANAANTQMLSELAQKLGSMCSPYTADTIEAEDVTKMRRDWEEYTQTLMLLNSSEAMSQVSDAVASYIDALAEYTTGKPVRGQVEQRRDRAMRTARVLLFSKAA